MAGEKLQTLLSKMQSIKNPQPGDEPDQPGGNASSAPIKEDMDLLISDEPTGSIVSSQFPIELGIARKPVGGLEKTLQLIRARETKGSKTGKSNQPDARRKLGTLLADLSDVVNEVPADLDYFDFTISCGFRPRLWIDPTTFVSLSADGKAFRLFRDTKEGRILVKKSEDQSVISDSIIEYVASRLSEREKSLSSDLTEKLIGAEPAKVDKGSARMSLDDHEMLDNSTRRSPMRSFFYFILGIIVGAGALIAIAWFRTELGL